MKRKILRISVVLSSALLCAPSVAAEDVSLFSCGLRQGGAADLTYTPSDRTFTLHLTGTKAESFSFRQARQSVQSWAKGMQTYIVLDNEAHFFGIEYIQSAFEGKDASIRTSRQEPPQLRECITSTIKFKDLLNTKSPDQRRYILWELPQNGLTQLVK